MLVLLPCSVLKHHELATKTPQRHQKQQNPRQIQAIFKNVVFSSLILNTTGSPYPPLWLRNVPRTFISYSFNIRVIYQPYECLPWPLVYLESTRALALRQRSIRRDLQVVALQKNWLLSLGFANFLPSLPVCLLPWSLLSPSIFFIDSKWFYFLNIPTQFVSS